MPVQLLVPLKQDIHILEWVFLCFFFSVISAPLQLWVAVGTKVIFGAT